ncbi:MAG: hypothetical protein RL547_256, partial [Actinomycetota bacterium]
MRSSVAGWVENNRDKLTPDPRRWFLNSAS